MSRSKLPTTDELTREVIDLAKERSDRVDNTFEYTPESRWYMHPLKNARDGKHNNWTSATSGFIPADTVNYILSHDRIAEGVLNAAKIAAEKFEEWSDVGVLEQEHFVGLLEELVERFGLGAVAERYAAAALDEAGFRLIAPEENDENNRVDIRCATALFQVKLGGPMKDKSDAYKSSWKAPKESAAKNGEDRELLWVTPNGRIFKDVEGRGMDGWKRML